MPKISNQSKYPEQEIVNKKDYVIGTDYYDKKKTKTFPIQNLAQVLADILIEDGGIEINVGKTSQLINDGEFGDSRFVEENELQHIIDEILSNLDKYELTENKQNNLNPDGTGKKFPTVDAVIQAVYEINLKLSNKSDVDGANSVGNLKDSIDKRHSHPHQDVIDNITAQDITNWNNSIGQSHNPLSLGLNTVGLSLNAAAQILQLTPGYSIPTNVDITKWNNLSNSIGNYALRDASNLLNITNWRTVLDLYSKPQVDNLLNLKQDKLTAGANIQISPTNVISATDTTYSQGSGISIVSGVITNTAQNVTQTLGLSGQLLSLSNGGGSVVLPFTDWSDITNKPNTFAPSAHTHTSNEVISLTGYTLGTNNALSATDSLNTALGKLQAQVNSKTSNTGTVTSVTAGSGLAGGVITTSGIISLSAATLASLVLANSSLQPGDPISLLNNDVPYATESWVNSQGYLTSFTESDPTVPSHVKGISTTDIAYWNAKLNASALNGYATELWVQQQNYLTSFTETDPIFTGSPAFGITNANITNWNNAFNNSHTHANKALLDTYNQTNANITDAVNLRHSHANKTVLDSIVNKDISQWVNDSGYLTSFTESDPTVPLWVKSISQGDITYWNNKQDILTAGANIQISPTNVISATDTNTVTRLRGTIAGTYQSGDLTLLAGANVSIVQNGNDFTINSSYVNTTYTSSNGIKLIGNNFSPVYGTTANTVAQGNDSRFHSPVTIGTSNGLSLAGQVLSMALAGALTTGALSSTDWNTFNNKLDASALNGYATEVWANNRFSLLGHTHNTSEIIALTGYVLGTNTAIGTTDSLNTALGKIQAQINAKTSNLGTVTSITAGTGLSGGTITTSGTIALNSATLASLALANSALQVETDPIFTASPAYGITAGNISAWNAKQNQLTNGLHTIINGNKVDVAFEVNTPIRDKNDNERLIFGDTQPNDVVIKGAVTNGDFKIKDSTDADLFRINGANKVPYFPQLPAPQTGDLNLAVFDTGNGLWKHSTKISDLVTMNALTPLLNGKANVNGNNITNIPQWKTALGFLDSSDLIGYATETWANSRFSLLGHQHPISDVIGLQNALDGKLQDLEGVLGLGFNGGNLNEPYMYNRSGSYTFLATRDWAYVNFATISQINNKANVNGNNITNIVDWRNNLDIYSKGESDNKYAFKGALSAGFNVNDLYQSGIFSGLGLINAVGSGDIAILNIPNWNGNNPSNRYNLQISSGNAVSSGELWFRTTDVNGDGAWRSVWHSSNFDPSTKANVNGSNVPLPTIASNLVNLAYLQGNYFDASYANSNFAKIDGSNLTNITNWQTQLGVGDWNQYDGANLATQGLYGMLYDNSVNKWRPSSNTTFKTWLDLSAYALTSQIPTVNDGTFTVQGDGVWTTGSGSTSANASANTSSTITLTQTVKDDITAGTEASAQITNLFGDCQIYFEHHDVSAGGSFDMNPAFYNLLDPKGAQPNVNVSKHHVHGARLILHSYIGVGPVIYTGEFTIENMYFSFVEPENGQKMEFTWNEDDQVWVYVLPN